MFQSFLEWVVSNVASSLIHKGLRDFPLNLGFSDFYFH